MTIKLLPLTLGFALIATAASAQGYRSDFRDERGRGEMRDIYRGEPDSRGGPSERRGMAGRDEAMPARDDERGYGGTEGAGLWIRSGETRLGVKCPAGESMRSCVDAAVTLLNQVRASQPSPAASGAPGSGGATGPAPSTPSR